MADTTALQDEGQLQLIKRLAAEADENKAVSEIRAQATRDVGKYGKEAVELAVTKLAGMVQMYKEEHKTHVTGYADVLVREEVAVSTGINKNGVQGATASGQTHLGKVGEVNFFGGASGALDNKGNVAGGSRWVNGAGPVYDLGAAKVIPVGQLSMSAQPNSPFNAGNIGAMAGAVINPDGTKNNVAVLLGGTLDGKNLNLTVNDSHDWDINKHVVATGNVGLTQGLQKDGNTTFVAGGRLHDKHYFGPTTGAAVEAGAFYTPGTKGVPSDYGGMLKFSATFGNEPAKEGPTPLQEAMMDATGKGSVQIAAADADPAQPYNNASPKVLAAAKDNTQAQAPAAASAPMPPAKNPDYNFLDLSKKDQQTVLTLMAKTFHDANPDVSIKDSKGIIMDKLAAANYQVDSHNTKTRADDTPQHVEDRVATR